MTLYARSDVESILVAGGCGKQHHRDGDEFALDCPRCEAVITADRRLKADWGDDLDSIPLTPEEEAERRRLEEREERIEAQQRLMRAEQRAAEIDADARRKARKPASKPRG